MSSGYKTTDIKSVIVDPGTNNTAYGMSDAEAPKKVRSQQAGIAEAVVNQGNVTDWEEYKKVLLYILEDERRRATETALFLTDAPLDHTNDRYESNKNEQKMLEVCFEDIGIPKFYKANQACLALFHSGRITGTIIESGEATTYITSVYEGWANPQTVRRLDIGGSDCTQILADYVNSYGERQFDVKNNPKDRKIIRDMKEAVCFVAADPKNASIEAGDIDYKLPDGTVISVKGHHRSKTAEALFDPERLGPSTIQRATVESIKAYRESEIDRAQALDIAYDLYENIVMAGGATRFEGIGERCKTEINKEKLDSNYATNAKVEVDVNNDRSDSVWYGGAILANNAKFNQRWITREMYEERGLGCIATCL